MKEDRIKLHELQNIVRLIKKVNCSSYATIAEIAKEAGMKKTAVMAYIETCPKLFDLTQVANKGLAVIRVYNSADENPKTEEWLEKMKKMWDKKLHVMCQWYYGYLEFFYIDVDGQSIYRENEYRNTPEKIAELEAMGLKRQRRVYGGLSDTYWREAFMFTDELQKTLEEPGWTTDFEEVKEEAHKQAER